MARGGRRQGVRDDANSISSPQKLRSLIDQIIADVRLPTPAISFRDLRTFHPEPDRKPTYVNRRDSARLVVPSKRETPKGRMVRYDPPASVAFARPRDVAVCVRRKRRREVLHALRHAGAGGGRKRKRRRARWNEHSYVRC